jgi:hypothetical protein
MESVRNLVLVHQARAAAAESERDALRAVERAARQELAALKSRAAHATILVRVMQVEVDALLEEAADGEAHVATSASGGGRAASTRRTSSRTMTSAAQGRAAAGHAQRREEAARHLSEIDAQLTAVHDAARRNIQVWRRTANNAYVHRNTLQLPPCVPNPDKGCRFVMVRCDRAGICRARRALVPRRRAVAPGDPGTAAARERSRRSRAASTNVKPSAAC